MHSAGHVHGLPGSQEYMGAFQISLWTSDSPVSPIKLVCLSFSSPSYLWAGLGSYNVKWLPLVCFLFFFFSFLAVPHVLWDLNSPTRDWTQVIAVKAQNPNHLLLIKKQMPLGIWLFPLGELQLKSDEDGLASVVFRDMSDRDDLLGIDGWGQHLLSAPSTSCQVFKATVEVGEADGRRAS